MEILSIGLWLLFGIGTATVASNKGRSGVGWFVLGVLFGPIALLIVICISPAARPLPPAVSYDERKCPYCAEMIKAEARVCRYCGRDVPEVEPASIQRRTRQLSREEFTRLTLPQQVAVKDYGRLLSVDDARTFSQMLGNFRDGTASRFVEQCGERVIYRG